MNFQVLMNSLFKAAKLERKNGIIIAMFLWCRLVKEQYYNTSYYLNGYSRNMVRHFVTHKRVQADKRHPI